MILRIGIPRKYEKKRLQFNGRIHSIPSNQLYAVTIKGGTQGGEKRVDYDVSATLPCGVKTYKPLIVAKVPFFPRKSLFFLTFG